MMRLSEMKTNSFALPSVSIKAEGNDAIKREENELVCFAER